MRVGLTSAGDLVRATNDGLLVLDFAGDVADLIRSGVDPETLPTKGTLPGDAELDAPLRPGKIVAVGLNYLDHIRETGMERPATPGLFAKWPSSMVGPTQDIVVSRSLTDFVDFEVELGVIVGMPMRAVPAERALEHVFGYTVANDVSARDIQVEEPTVVRAKSLDTFCPTGPVVVTRDEIPDPQSLRLWTKVNGTTMQDSTTAEMVFGVAELLSFCSNSFTLEMGDLLLTGTPDGVGFLREPRVSLQDGDLVETGVDGIGSLANRVRELPAGGAR